MLSQERFRKQEILLTAVRQQGIATQELLDYLRSKKGEDFNNIDTWSIKELEECISDIVAKSTEEYLKFIIRKQPMFNEETYREVIHCKQIPQNMIMQYCSQNPKVVLQAKIPEWKIIDEGLFASNYVLYKIEVHELDWVVWRRVEQFQWLADMLQHQYPDSLMPPLPAKTLVRKFRENHLSKRQKMLEQFINSVISNPMLRQSDLVEGFLSFDDEVKFKQIVLASQALKTPAKICEYTTVEGILEIDFNPYTNQYFLDMGSYCNKSSEIYKEMTDSSRLVGETLQELSTRIGSLTKNVGALKESTSEFNKKTKIGAIYLNEYVYTLLEQYLVNWNDHISKLAHVINQNFYEFFRFQRDMQSRCVDLISNRFKIQSQYFKEKQDLMKKKLKYFTSEPIEKWQLNTEQDKVKLQGNKEEAIPLMFPKETEQVELLKQRYAYCNRQAFEQINQYFDHKGVVYATRLGRMSETKKQNNEDQQKLIDEISFQFEQMLKLRNGEKSEAKGDWQDEYYSQLSINYILQ